jgi:hypothetical protein
LWSSIFTHLYYMLNYLLKFLKKRPHLNYTTIILVRIDIIIHKKLRCWDFWWIHFCIG